jgi:hypothetical protein
MFGFGNKVVPLAETLGQNTLKHRESRDQVVKNLSAITYAAVVVDLKMASAASIEPEAKFDFSKDETKKKVSGFNGVSDQERSRILANVVAKLKEDKLEAEVAEATLTVRWTVPVVVQPAPAPAKVEEKPAEAAKVEEKPAEADTKSQ